MIDRTNLSATPARQRAFCLVLLIAILVGIINSPNLRANTPEFPVVGPEPLELTAQFKMHPDSNEGVLMIIAEVAPGWHIYSQNHGGPEHATSIEVADSRSFLLLDVFKANKPAHSKTKQGKVSEYFEGKVIWHAPIKLAEGVDPASLNAEVEIHRQVCNAAGFCLPPDTMTLVAAHAGQLVTDEMKFSDVVEEPVKSAGDWEGMSLLLVLPLAFLAGLILNVMPCVLPVIGLKVMSFVQQAGENPVRVFVLNLVFAIGMIVVFLILATLAVFFGYGWGELYESLLFKVIMIGVVFVFGLSFFGVWEIPIPGFVGDASASKAAQKEGMVGAFLKGVLTTLLATPCSGPLLIPAVVWAIAQPPLITYLVFLAMGIGMAFPFLVIGAMPKLAMALPRPGAWMETFKQLMGFVLMATCVFFLGSVGNKYTVSVLSLLVFLGLSCWYIGRSEESSAFADKFKGWVYALVIGAAGVWFSFFFLLPQYELEYKPFSQATLQKHVDDGDTVFVDFTADW